MKKSKSIFIEYNNTGIKSFDENGNPLNGERIHADGYNDGKIILLRFKNGFLDGDIFDTKGKLVMQKPAVETEGHIEYWRKGMLHRDNGLPAVSTNGFTEEEWWENNKRIK